MFLASILVNCVQFAMGLIHSHVICTDDEPARRVCRVKNLLLDLESESWFISIVPQKSIVYKGYTRLHRIVDLTSIPNHNVLYLNFQVLDHELPREKIVASIGGTSQLLRRFLPNNIMHIIHDDWLGSWHIQKILWPQINQTIFIDRYPKRTMYSEIYDSLAPATHYKEIKRKFKSGLVLFEDAIIGNSKELIWYQYGFRKPQSPLKKTVDGDVLRTAARHLLNTTTTESPHDRLLLFSRGRNRLIINEKELVETIERKTRFIVEVVRLEDYEGRLRELASKISMSRGVVGMHGSMLVLSMWLPKGSLVIEMFPYAIPAKDYLPYRRLCEILDIKYMAWENRDPSKSVAHPDRPAILGGIAHLPETIRRSIEKETNIRPHRCCRNPNWLYRIYQDSIVDVNEIARMVFENL